MDPKGGSELQLAFLNKHVKKDLLDKFSITLSVPESKPLDKNKINILWLKNSYNQPNLMPWFSDKKNHDKYDWYVFNSHWSYEKFRMAYDVPTKRCVVIKNGLGPVKLKTNFYKKGDKLRILYHSTPWRGLNVLLGAMQLVKSNVELDVYSSTQIYGDHFKKEFDHEYADLYKQAEDLPNVNYMGYQDHQYLVDNLPTYDALVYPSIFEETFCNAAVEALACGLFMVCTNYGALFETCGEFPVYVPYEDDYEKLSRQFAFAIDEIPNQLAQPACIDQLKFQQKYFNYFYTWEKKKMDWINFLTGVSNARTK